jgi:hypothetical protein
MSRYWNWRRGQSELPPQKTASLATQVSDPYRVSLSTCLYLLFYQGNESTLISNIHHGLFMARAAQPEMLA